MVKAAVRALRKVNIRIDSGLTEDELRAAEAKFEFVFPPDLREFLALGLPRGPRFPNWRQLHSESLSDSMNWPTEGICFDVEQNAFWMPQWGSRPVETEEALACARAFLKTVPPLVPVYGHRYMPTEPSSRGNPVISVYQTDIITYGDSLWDYFNQEFKTRLPAPTAAERTNIPFWMELVG